MKKLISTIIIAIILINSFGYVFASNEITNELSDEKINELYDAQRNAIGDSDNTNTISGNGEENNSNSFDIEKFKDGLKKARRKI